MWHCDDAMRSQLFGGRGAARRTALLIIVCTAFVTGCSGVADADEPTQTAGVAITGDVRTPLTITPDELRALPPQTESVTFESGTGPQSHTYVGAMLNDVVSAADPIVDTSAKNPLLSLAIRATGADGYTVALAWAEVLPDFTATPVLIAYTEDEIPLDRPRLVVPGDIEGGRYVTDLSELRVVSLRG
jgi:hypothetical protein